VGGSRPKWRSVAASLAIAAVLACLAVGPAQAASSSPIGASVNLAGLETVGTAMATAADELPPPHKDNTLLILGGQQLDTPEGVAGTIAELSALKAVHGTVARITVPWTMLETQYEPPGAPPDFNPLSVQRVTAALDAARSFGIKVIFQISNTPCGRSSSWSSPPGNTACEALGPWSTYPPKLETDLTNAVAEVIGLWGPDIYAIEVWNEPNQSFLLSDQRTCDPTAPADVHGPSSDSTRAAAYVPMVKAVWEAVKASGFPGILVVAGAVGLSDTAFLQDLYNDGIAGYYDAISVHPYQVQLTWLPVPNYCGGPTGREACQDSSGKPPCTPSIEYADTQDPATCPSGNSEFCFATGVEAMHNVMVGNGDSTRPLFLTEFGFPTCLTGSQAVQFERSASFSYAGWCVSLTEQENWLNESVNMIRAWPYVGAATIYSLRDPSEGEDPFSLYNFGLMPHDFTAKPSYAGLALG
jgi:hypothetical protein